MLVALPYLNTFRVPFYEDDRPHITNNPSVVGMGDLSAKRLWDAAFTSPLPSRPVPNLTLGLNYYLHGFSLPGYHAFNQLVHSLCVVLLFHVFFLLLTFHENQILIRNRRMVAFLAALLWGVHPIHTQVVTYIVQRMTSMAALFYLSSFRSFLIYRNEASKHPSIHRILSCLFYVLALGSKETSLTLPLLVLIYELLLVPGKPGQALWRRFSGTFLFGGLAAGASVFYTIFYATGFNKFQVALGVESFPGIQASLGMLVSRALTNCRALFFYLELLGTPSPKNLSLFREFEASRSLFEPPTTTLALLATAGLVWACVSLRKSNPLAVFLVLWFPVHLSVEGAMAGLRAVFDHRMYLSSAGVVLLCVGLLAPRILRNRAVLLMGLASVSLALGTMTLLRNRIWADPETFWQLAVKNSPSQPGAWNNLGIVYAEKGRYEEALGYYEESLHRNPNYLFAHQNRAHAFIQLGEYEKALTAAEFVLSIDSGWAKSHEIAAMACEKLGDSAQALSHYEKAAALSKTAHSYALLGSYLSRLAEWQEAAHAYQKALDRDPRYEDVYVNLGALYLLNLNKPTEARKIAEKGLDHSPEDPDLLVIAGLSHCQLLDFPVALTLLWRAKGLTSPGYPRLGLLEDGLAKASNGIRCFR
ncbi:MAG: tetratricopeptide repeat protein [Nitrospirae bacterium]|nr:tetratricopeptide repeat protein [Nitrospirota bacterium]